jgi:hypothetical protein
MSPDDPTDRNKAHETRVHEAFDAFLGQHGERLDANGHSLLGQMRDAASQKSQDRLREHLTEAKERHGWLYRELASHPQLATLLDELALWGF